MAEMSARDIERDIVNTVIMCNGVPSLAKNITADARTITVRPVRSTEEIDVPFSLKAITPINGRVGMVNGATGGVYYIARVPFRRMQIGMSWNNSSLTCIFDKDRADYFQVKEFQHHGLEDAINNRYPSFRQAFKFAKTVEGACAFDKQFAVDYQGTIYYKDQGKVGKVRDTAKSVEEIIWNKDKEHLQIVLENDYEKTARTFRN